MNSVRPAYIKRIRDLREDADLTQKEVASYLGTSQTMYARYERGANELPLRHLVALCRLYRVSADYLLGADDGHFWAAEVRDAKGGKPPK